MKTIIKSDIVSALKSVGLQNGDSVMVHTSLGQIGYVCGGAQTIIEALIDVVGQNGTIMMPTQSWKNLDPETGVHWDADEADWDTIRENWPAYDKAITPTNTMGAVAEMFRSWPGTLRSDHPARSVAAWGKNAKYLTENSEVSIMYYNSEMLGVNLPEKVELEVVKTEPGVKGNTATTATKEAVLSTGLVIRVPLFINENDIVIVSTSDGKYVSRK